MIGSRRKVRQVFEHLRAQGITDEVLARVYAPIGLDIGADSPSEIAVSALAEIVGVLRKTGFGSLRNTKENAILQHLKPRKCGGLPSDKN